MIQTTYKARYIVAAYEKLYISANYVRYVPVLLQFEIVYHYEDVSVIIKTQFCQSGPHFVEACATRIKGLIKLEKKIKTKTKKIRLLTGTKSFLTSSTARSNFMCARFSVSSTVIKTCKSSDKCSQFGLPRLASSCKADKEKKEERTN